MRWSALNKVPLLCKILCLLGLHSSSLRFTTLQNLNMICKHVQCENFVSPEKAVWCVSVVIIQYIFSNFYEVHPNSFEYKKYSTHDSFNDYVGRSAYMVWSVRMISKLRRLRKCGHGPFLGTIPAYALWDFRKSENPQRAQMVSQPN